MKIAEWLQIEKEFIEWDNSTHSNASQRQILDWFAEKFRPCSSPELTKEEISICVRDRLYKTGLDTETIAKVSDDIASALHAKDSPAPVSDAMIEAWGESMEDDLYERNHSSEEVYMIIRNRIFGAIAMRDGKIQPQESKEGKKETKIECRYCGSEFTDEYELEAHVNFHHNQFSKNDKLNND